MLIGQHSGVQRQRSQQKHLKVTPTSSAVHVLAGGFTKLLEDEYARHESLFSATIKALHQQKWEDAEKDIQPYIAAVLSEEPASVYLSCVRQLHILVYIHWRLSPERSYQKIVALTHAIARTGVPKSFSVALHNYLDENLIQYGVVLYVIEHDFAIRPCDVQGLLDRFRWNVRKDTGVKDHIYGCLCLRCASSITLPRP